MRHLPRPLVFLLSLLVLAPVSAAAAPITVLAPGIVVAPLRSLASQWAAQTGNQVDVRGGNVQSVSAAADNGPPADLVILPDANLRNLKARIRPRSQRAIGRVVFGMVVKRGGAHPDISTPEKFVEAVRNAGVLAFGDPSAGSLSGRMVDQMLHRAQFSGVEPRPVQGMIGEAIVRGDAEFGVGPVSEILMTRDAELVGRIPDSLDMHIDVAGAVLNTAAAPAEASGFLRFLASSAARDAWTAGGVDARPAGRRD